MQFATGTVLVTQAGTDWLGRLVAWTQGSPWTHVVMITGPDTFVESQAFTGVVERPLAPFLAQLAREGRAWVALDRPELTDAQRTQLATAARRFVGRRYDYMQAALWFLTHGFWWDGELRMICSRLITACYRVATGRPLFDTQAIAKLNAKRQEDLRSGYCTPLTLLELSNLTVVATSLGAVVPPRA